MAPGLPLPHAAVWMWPLEPGNVLLTLKNEAEAKNGRSETQSLHVGDLEDQCASPKWLPVVSF